MRTVMVLVFTALTCFLIGVVVSDALHIQAAREKVENGVVKVELTEKSNLKVRQDANGREIFDYGVTFTDEWGNEYPVLIQFQYEQVRWSLADIGDIAIISVTNGVVDNIYHHQSNGDRNLFLFENLVHRFSSSTNDEALTTISGPYRLESRVLITVTGQVCFGPIEERMLVHCGQVNELELIDFQQDGKFLVVAGCESAYFNADYIQMEYSDILNAKVLLSREEAVRLDPEFFSVKDVCPASS